MEEKSVSFCIYCYQFYKNRSLLFLFTLKIVVIVYMLFVFKQTVPIKEFGPYPGSNIVESSEIKGPTLSLSSFIKQVSPTLTMVYFILNILMGIESNLHFLERLEKKYIIADSMGKYTLQGLLWRVYIFDLVYMLGFSILTGLIVGLPLKVYSLSSKWLVFGLASGALLFLSWLALFSLVIGFSRNQATGLLSYILASILLYFAGSLSRSKANLFDFTSFSASVTSSQYELFKAQIPMYPVEIMAIMLALGILSAVLGVSRYEAR